MSNASCRSVSFAVLAVVVLLFAQLICVGSAYANSDWAVPVTSAQASKIAKKTINTTNSFTWVKAGKEFYQWSNYRTKAKNGTLRPREAMTSYLPWDNATESEAVPKRLRSTNGKVVTAKKTKYGYIKYSSEKYGKATITYTLAYTDSTNTRVIEHVTEKHKMLKYANPVRLLKVGKKDYAGKFKKTPQCNAKSALKGVLSAKPAKGWKLVRIRQVDSNVLSGEYVHQTRLKNGKRIKLSKTAESALEVICYNKAGKYYSSVVLAPNFKYGVIYG